MNKKTKSPYYKVGVGLIVMSFIFWLIPLIIPFLSFSTTVKAGAITGSLVIGEIMFWIGALLAGKEVVVKIKSYLNPGNWKKKLRDQEEQNNETHTLISND